MGCTCGDPSTGHAFVVGRVGASFTSSGARWEYTAQSARLGTHALAEVVAHAPFLGRFLVFGLDIDGRDVYRLLPRSAHELAELVAVARIRDPGLPATDGGSDEAAIAGVVEEMDGGGHPCLVVEAIHHWSLGTHAALLGEGGAGALDTLMRASHNPGLSEGDRALNFVIARSEELYRRAGDLARRGCTRLRLFHDPCRLAHRRREVNVVLGWVEPAGAPEFASLRVDVTDLHPFPTDDAFRPYHPKHGGG